MLSFHIESRPIEPPLPHITDLSHLPEHPIQHIKPKRTNLTKCISKPTDPTKFGNNLLSHTHTSSTTTPLQPRQQPSTGGQCILSALKPIQTTPSLSIELNMSNLLLDEPHQRCPKLRLLDNHMGRVDAQCGSELPFQSSIAPNPPEPPKAKHPSDTPTKNTLPSHLHNYFPIYPMPLSPVTRPVPQPLPISHVPLHRRGTILDIYGTMSLTMLTSPPPRMTQIPCLHHVMCCLKYEVGTLDYHLIFAPKSFIYTSKNHPRNRPHSSHLI